MNKKWIIKSLKVILSIVTFTLGLIIILIESSILHICIDLLEIIEPYLMYGTYSITIIWTIYFTNRLIKYAKKKKQVP